MYNFWVKICVTKVFSAVTFFLHCILICNYAVCLFLWSLHTFLIPVCPYRYSWVAIGSHILQVSVVCCGGSYFAGGGWLREYRKYSQGGYRCNHTWWPRTCLMEHKQCEE